MAPAGEMLPNAHAEKLAGSSPTIYSLVYHVKHAKMSLIIYCSVSCFITSMLTCCSYCCKRVPDHCQIVQRVIVGNHIPNISNMQPGHQHVTHSMRPGHSTHSNNSSNSTSPHLQTNGRGHRAAGCGCCDTLASRSMSPTTYFGADGLGAARRNARGMRCQVVPSS